MLINNELLTKYLHKARKILYNFSAFYKNPAEAPRLKRRGASLFI